MIVKICGITHREDALAAVEGGASALGFNFYPKSPRYLTWEQAAAIMEGVPANVWKVGVFVNRDFTKLPPWLALDVFQLHGDQIEHPPAVRVWRAVPVDERFHLADVEALPVEAVLLDAPSGREYGGTGRTFPWAAAAGRRKKIVLAGGLDADNVRQAVEIARPWGVDACSRLEISPGRKDPVRLAAFLKALREL
ncbi:MAG: phosphoribosylanthranilate isomerase [Acidobacteria bacterium]|nr:phosphoribosylanthranilate isomerase [Acidobacteriota bacterium]